MKRIRRKRKEEEAVDNVRRITMRRRGASFSSTSLSDSSHGGGVAATPEQDEPDLNQEVIDQASQPPEPPEPSEQSEQSTNLQSISNDVDFNPAAQLQRAARRSSQFEREYRLSLLHRLLMRKIPMHQIAEQLQVSASTLQRDKAELSARLREAAKDLNIDEMVGANKEFYEEVQSMAMRAASNAQVPMPMRLAAMRTALAGRNDMHRFFQAAGVYDVLRFRRAPGGEGQNDIQKMLSLAEDMMTENARERREDGPDPLGEFSGGDSENVNL